MRTRDPDKQKRIKDAMVKLILREGIENASVSKIAREAGVSPATIYVYYDSKEDMMAEVFREYAARSYHYTMRFVKPDMGGRELIDALVRGYYDFSIRYEDIFSFVEQCSHCPTLQKTVSEEECFCDVLDVIRTYQDRGVMKRFSSLNLSAVLFAPVRFLAQRDGENAFHDNELSELIRMLQDMLLI